MAGLTQDMYDPSVLLDFRDILLSPGITGDDGPLSINPAYTSTSTSIPPMSSTSINQPISVQITLSLIADAIKRIHKESVSHIFKENKSLYPSMPILDRVSPHATEYYQFGAIFEDEGTISGTMGVHDNIFLQQLHLDPDIAFKERLWLLYSNQLTVHHI
jgi:hypothetical protein